MRKRSASAALVWALAMILAASSHGQQPGERESHLGSLVLVIKVISSTHARPVTGLVIRAPETGAALVMVPAEFVSAGDEILVLDGGGDLLRDGRPARTVARSAEAGVALLEVEDLHRPGAVLSSDAWPPTSASPVEFAAWPPAAELSEGATLVRRNVRLVHADGQVRLEADAALPEVSAPLFDRCGQLRGLRLAGDTPRLVAAKAVSALAAEAGFTPVVSPCGDRPEIEPAAGAPDEPLGEAEGVAPPDESSAASELADSFPMAVVQPEAPEALPWGWAGALLVLVGGLLYFGLNARLQRSGVILEGGPAGGRSERHWIRCSPGGGPAGFQRSGLQLQFEWRDGRLVVSGSGGEGSGPAFFLGDTPCLPGEAFFLYTGQVIRLGDEVFKVRLVAAENEEAVS